MQARCSGRKPDLFGFIRADSRQPLRLHVDDFQIFDDGCVAPRACALVLIAPDPNAEIAIRAGAERYRLVKPGEDTPFEMSGKVPDDTR